MLYVITRVTGMLTQKDSCSYEKLGKHERGSYFRERNVMGRNIEVA